MSTIRKVNNKNIDAKKVDEYFLAKALFYAKKAYSENEVPVGAIIVKDGKIIASGYNQTIKKNDPTAHAEIIVLKKASQKLKNYRLNNTILYVTKEPCVMCAGALVNARVKEVVFGCYDKRFGACGSIFNIANNKKLNHRIKITGGVLEMECRFLLQKFFKERRKN